MIEIFSWIALAATVVLTVFAFVIEIARIRDESK
jgi:hypothetical protein